MRRPKSVFSMMLCMSNNPGLARPGFSAALSLSAAPLAMRLLRSVRLGTLLEPEKRLDVYVEMMPCHAVTNPLA